MIDYQLLGPLLFCTLFASVIAWLAWAAWLELQEWYPPDAHRRNGRLPPDGGA